MTAARWLAATLAGALAACATAKEFRSADVHPDDYPTVRAVRALAEEVQRRTGGRHTLRVFAGGQLGGEMETIELARAGALDLVRVNVGPMNAHCPATLVPTMPFLFRSTQHLRSVLDGPIGDELLRACDAHGFVGLAFYDGGARSLYTVGRPVRRPADAKGLRLRVQQSEVWVAAVRALGARAAPMPYGEVYTALKAGLVDGAENNWPSYETSRHHEVARHYALTEHSMAPEMLLMSRRAWDALSAEDQRIFRDAARASVGPMRAWWDAKERASRDAVVGAGARVVDVDKAAFRRVMAPVYEKFITDPAHRRLVARIRATPDADATPTPTSRR